MAVIFNLNMLFSAMDVKKYIFTGIKAVLCGTFDLFRTEVLSVVVSITIIIALQFQRTADNSVG